jgi:hypothetical protein
MKTSLDKVTSSPAIKKKKRFGGISFNLLEIRANKFDGYGFTFFDIRWDWLMNYTQSSTRCLLFINLVKAFEYGGEEWRLRGGMLFFQAGNIYTKVIKPRKKNCDNCGDYCETTKHFYGDTPFCSAMCRMDGIN